MSVAAAIVDGDRVLVIRRRDNGKWEPPGGTLEPGETILGGLRREVLEETGLEIGDPTLIGIYKNMERAIVALVFRCEYVGGQPRTTQEAMQSAWMTRVDVERELDPAYACRLIDAFDPGSPIIRIHDGIQLLPNE